MNLCRMLRLDDGFHQKGQKRWTTQRPAREILVVECLNRRQRRDRMKNPGKYNQWVPKTKYAPVGTDGNYGRRSDLVSETAGLPTGMAVTWLGTSSGAPTINRNVSSILLRLPEKTLVFDVGEGTQVQLIKTHVFPPSIQKIFITHLHGDHCFGLPGLLSLINEMRLFHDRGEMMYVYGPPGLGELMRMSLPHWFGRLRMPITIVEFTVDSHADIMPRIIDSSQNVFVQKMRPTNDRQSEEPSKTDQNNNIGSDLMVGMERGCQWEIDVGDGITVTASQLHHRVPCWGYVVKEADYMPAQWEIDVWKKQQLDNSATTAVSIDDEAARKELAYTGRKVVILGDTCNSETMLSIGQDADLLSHEATFSDDMWQKAIKAKHSTSTMAGEFAKKLNAKRLVLTHFSPRYCRGNVKQQRTGGGNGNVNMLVAQAKKAFGRSAVKAAHDFATCHVPINRQN